MALSNEQKRVYDWLNDELGYPVFAEAYKGSVILLNNKTPGYISFVAHAGRDLMNGLAYTYAGVQRQQVQYKQQVDNFQDEWLDEWGTGNDLAPDEDQLGHLIPIDVCQKISRLVEDHKSGRSRSLEADFFFFSTFLDYSDKDKIPINFLSEWKTAKNWFVGHAHLREKPFSSNTALALQAHFKCLDGYLYIAASSQYDRLTELNAILDATNN